LCYDISKDSLLHYSVGEILLGVFTLKRLLATILITLFAFSLMFATCASQYAPSQSGCNCSDCPKGREYPCLKCPVLITRFGQEKESATVLFFLDQVRQLYEFAPDVTVEEASLGVHLGSSKIERSDNIFCEYYNTGDLYKSLIIIVDDTAQIDENEVDRVVKLAQMIKQNCGKMIVIDVNVEGSENIGVKQVFQESILPFVDMVVTAENSSIGYEAVVESESLTVKLVRFENLIELLYFLEENYGEGRCCD